MGVLKMIKYVKKSLYSGRILAIVFLFMYNLTIIPEANKIYSFFFDFWSILFVIAAFLNGFLVVAFIFIFSKVTRKNIYEYKKMLVHISIVYFGIGDLSTRLFSDHINNSLFRWIIIFLTLILAIYIMSVFWKYRKEISSGLLLVLTIYFHFNLIGGGQDGLLITILRNNLDISYFSQTMKGVLLLIILAVYLSILISLRKFGVYDYRESEELRQEARQEGLYSKHKIAIFNSEKRI